MEIKDYLVLEVEEFKNSSEVLSAKQELFEFTSNDFGKLSPSLQNYINAPLGTKISKEINNLFPEVIEIIKTIEKKLDSLLAIKSYDREKEDPIISKGFIVLRKLDKSSELVNLTILFFNRIAVALESKGKNTQLTKVKKEKLKVVLSTKIIEAIDKINSTNGVAQFLKNRDITNTSFPEKINVFNEVFIGKGDFVNFQHILTMTYFLFKNIEIEKEEVSQNLNYINKFLDCIHNRFLNIEEFSKQDVIIFLQRINELSQKISELSQELNELGCDSTIAYLLLDKIGEINLIFSEVEEYEQY